MTKLTDKEMEELETLARAAPPGPWHPYFCNSGEGCWCRCVGNKEGDDSLEHTIASCGDLRKRAAEFIAAANPAMALSLLKELRALRKLGEAAEANRWSAESSDLIDALADWKELG